MGVIPEFKPKRVCLNTNNAKMGQVVVQQLDINGDLEPSRGEDSLGASIYMFP